MNNSQPPNYSKYLKSAKWRNISSDMKKCANYVCNRCGKKFHSGELDVHHLNYERLGKEHPSDLQVLCRTTCHPIADATRVENVATRREKRRYELGRDTYMSKKYGDNHAMFADEGMHEQYDRWLVKKGYGEFGEDW